jgi:hypothetical protein
MIDGMICSFDRQPWHRRWMGALRAVVSPGGSDAQAISPESTTGFSPKEPVALCGEPQGSGQTDRALEFQH